MAFKDRKWWVAGGCLLVFVGFLIFRSTKEADTLNVPLGVEQAAIVTYGGPLVAVRPYKWGVGVNVRIAKVTEQASGRIYDVRYIVNRAGLFDLKEYLSAEDGSPLDGLPSFKFLGDPKLSQQLDTRIQQTEEIGVDVGGHYFLVLAGLAIFWIGWLLLLIFYGRPKPEVGALAAPPEPTVAELLRAFLRELELGTVNAEAKARMEMRLLRRWREELAIEELGMSASLEAIRRHEKTAEALNRIQHWLHDPKSKVTSEEIAASINPFTQEARKPEAAAL